MDLSLRASELATLDTAYVHEWVDSTSEQPVIDNGDADESLAARIYAGCITILRSLCLFTNKKCRFISVISGAMGPETRIGTDVSMG